MRQLPLNVVKMVSLKFRRLTWSTIKKDKENFPLSGLLACSQTDLRDYGSHLSYLNRWLFLAQQVLVMNLPVIAMVKAFLA